MAILPLTLRGTAFARRFALALVGAAALAAPGQAQQPTVEIQRYYQAVERICQTGITPEVVKRYEAAVRAVEATRYGGGRDNNFFGLSSPESFYNRCFQSPGTLR